MSTNKPKKYRIVHVFGAGRFKGEKLDDQVCLIENDDGADIGDSHQLKFFWKFIDDEDFEDHLRKSETSPSSGLIIDSYYEYDGHLNRVWWHWDEHSWKKIKNTHQFYRTAKGTIVAKVGGVYSLSRQQSLNSDGSIYVSWSGNYSGARPELHGLDSDPRSRSILPSSIESLQYEGLTVFCDCPFCGQTESGAISTRVRLVCTNCRKAWSIWPDS